MVEHTKKDKHRKLGIQSCEFIRDEKKKIAGRHVKNYGIRTLKADGHHPTLHFGRSVAENKTGEGEESLNHPRLRR